MEARILGRSCLGVVERMKREAGSYTKPTKQVGVVLLSAEPLSEVRCTGRPVKFRTDASEIAVRRKGGGALYTDPAPVLIIP